MGVRGAGVVTSALRFYEGRGLVPTERTDPAQDDDRQEWDLVAALRRSRR